VTLLCLEGVELGVVAETTRFVTEVDRGIHDGKGYRGFSR
jgi:hypothetical protein